MNPIKEKATIAEMEHKPERVSHVEDTDKQAAKSKKVFSVDLADAVAKDNPSAWSPSMIRLYLVMVFVTLGT